jgi:hypothetical protein
VSRDDFFLWNTVAMAATVLPASGCWGRRHSAFGSCSKVWAQSGISRFSTTVRRLWRLRVSLFFGARGRATGFVGPVLSPARSNARTRIPDRGR